MNIRVNTNARSSAAEEFEAGNRFGGRGSVVCVVSNVGKHDFRRVEIEIGVKRAVNEVNRELEDLNFR